MAKAARIPVWMYAVLGIIGVMAAGDDGVQVDTGDGGEPIGGDAKTNAKGDVYYPKTATSSQRTANYHAAYNMSTRAVQAGLWGGGDTLPILSAIWGAGESLGNPGACKRAQGDGFWWNGARGFYQARPTTAYSITRKKGPDGKYPSLKGYLTRDQMQALCGNLPVQTALWLWTARRRYSRLSGTGLEMNAIALRSGGAGGSHVPKFAAGDYSGRPEVITRFKKAYAVIRGKGFNVPSNWESFAKRDIPRKGSWPGPRKVGEIIGVPSSDLGLLPT